jgi:hypothetical protein
MTQLYKSQRCHWHRCATNFVDLLRKYEALLKKALTRVSGALGELFDEKNRGRKSRGMVPLKMSLQYLYKNSLKYLESEVNLFFVHFLSRDHPLELPLIHISIPILVKQSK